MIEKRRRIDYKTILFQIRRFIKKEIIYKLAQATKNRKQVKDWDSPSLITLIPL
ncbi:hypothetical protein HMPREF9386_0109 [Streptococcus sanguinis SK330]|uniref:Uncharacterized protein n=1 Tax=Streptococcus sanguinis SK330 TaxID=888813 RepID=F2C4V6_STRSA|nr:hypothetical protein HMPREF9386_0109 [Streptococcus sanguinis SK330]